VGGAITVTLTVKLYGPSLESLLGSITVPVNVPVVVAGKVMLKLVTEPLLNGDNTILVMVKLDPAGKVVIVLPAPLFKVKLEGPKLYIKNGIVIGTPTKVVPRSV
jgi:hypothetical protein